MKLFYQHIPHAISIIQFSCQSTTNQTSHVSHFILNITRISFNLIHYNCIPLSNPITQRHTHFSLIIHAYTSNMITYIGQGKVEHNSGTNIGQHSASCPSFVQARGPRSSERSSLAQVSLPRSGERSSLAQAREVPSLR